MTDPTQAEATRDAGDAPRERPLLLILDSSNGGTALPGVIEALGHARIDADALAGLEDEALAAAGTPWPRLEPIAADAFAAPDPLARATALIAAERAEADGLAIGGRLTARLVPFWRSAIAADGGTAMIVTIVRAPGDEPIAALQWLRLMLDAERCGRGQARAFVTPDTSAERLRAALAGAPAPGDRPAAAAETGTWSRDVAAILGRWAETGEDIADHAALDRIREAFDAAVAQLGGALVPGIVAIADAALLREAKRTLDARIATLERQLATTLRDASLPGQGERQDREMIARIRAHPAFDAAWYAARVPDAARDGIDPAEHYFHIGARADRDPGPNFSTECYRDRYGHALGLGQPSFLHYILSGGIEGIEAHSPLSAEDRAEIELIRTHPLFDADWYLARYPDAGTTPWQAALHYHAYWRVLKTDPGPDFHGPWYAKMVFGERWHRRNPLLHYITEGAAQGLPIAPPRPDFGDFIWTPRAVTARAAARGALSGETRLAATAIDWSKTVEIADRLSLGGCWLANDAPAPVAARAATFAAMHGWAERAGDVATGLGEDGDVALTDLWFVNDRDVRLRVSAAEPVRVRAYQAEGTRLVRCGEGLVAEAGPVVIDVAAASPFLPMLIVATAPDGAARGAVLVPFPSLFRGGAHQAEVASTAPGEARFSAIAAYSDRLLGRHLAAEDEPAIAALAIDLRGATGAERIFARAFRDWITGFVGLRVHAEGEPPSRFLADEIARFAHAEGAVAGARAAAGRATLALPADALPTIAALFARGDDTLGSGEIGSFVLAGAIDGRPKAMIRVPAAAAAGLSALQPAAAPRAFPTLSPPQSGTAGEAAPLAIRFVSEAASDATLLLRRPLEDGAPLAAPAATRILAIATLSDVTAAKALLQTLADQTLADGLEVALRGDPAIIAAAETIAAALFPGRARTLPDDPGERARLTAAFDHLLLVDDGVLLHDPRTIQTLAALAAAEKVASAGCLHVAEIAGRKPQIVPRSSGLFAVETGAGAGVLAERSAFAAFPFATYPNAGNSLRLALVPASVWAETGGGFDAETEALFATRATAAGYRHLATGSVSALLRGDAAAPDPEALPAAPDNAPVFRELAS